MDNERIINAIRASLVSRGINKGSLLKTPPRSNSDAFAAWNAIMLVANPYKVRIGGLMFMSSDQRDIFDAVRVRAETVPGVATLDRDRRILESLGAW